MAMKKLEYIGIVIGGSEGGTLVHGRTDKLTIGGSRCRYFPPFLVSGVEAGYGFWLREGASTDEIITALEKSYIHTKKAQ